MIVGGGGGARKEKYVWMLTEYRENYRITSNKAPATDKEAVAEVHTSGERGFCLFVYFLLLLLFVCLFSQLHPSICSPTQTLCACAEGAPGFLSLSFPTRSQHSLPLGPLAAVGLPRCLVLQTLSRQMAGVCPRCCPGAALGSH